MKFGEEGAGFGALDDAVIVSAGDGQDLTQPQERASLLGDSREFRWIIDGSAGNDGSLAGH